MAQVLSGSLVRPLGRLPRRRQRLRQEPINTQAQAKARCGSATVVWVNLGSKIYHFAGHKSYGHTKSGAYMCESNAMNEGHRGAVS